MKKFRSKTKMVSFRLSPHEYTKLSDACHARGIESVSELARVAIQSLIQMEAGSEQAARHQLSALKDRIRLLTCDIDRLTKQLEEPDN